MVGQHVVSDDFGQSLFDDQSVSVAQAFGLARAPHHLSLGQKKRIAIATVLSMGTPILALDEPSASLAPAARRELIELLDELPQTMLISTHDLSLVRDLLPRTVVMDAGRVVADGPSEELLVDGDLLSAHGLEPLSDHVHPNTGTTRHPDGSMPHHN